MGLGQLPNAGGGGTPPVADTTLKRLALTPDALTGSAATSALSVTQTWNTTGAPTALLVGITDTASDAHSLLADFKVGGSSKFCVRKDGVGSFTATGPITFSSGAFLTWSGAGGLAGSTNGEFDFFRSGYSASTKLVVPSSNVLQIGQNHATTPTDQTIKAHDVTAGKGAGLDLVGGSSGDASGYGTVRLMAGAAPGVVVDELSGVARIGFFGVSATGQPNTGISAAGHSSGSSTAVTEDSTFGGYTIGQIVGAMQSLGLLN